MLAQKILVEDAGMIAVGPAGEREYGRRNFMDITSLFLTEPLLAVRWGQRNLGSVDPSSLASRDEHSRPTILLGGRAWGVRDIDWDRRVVWVEPADEPGRSRWAGAGAALSFEVCHAIRSVLAGDERLEKHLTQRGRAKFAYLQGEYPWATDGRTSLVRESARNRSRWWTFAGARANRAIAAQLDSAGLATMAIDDLGISLKTTVPLEDLSAVVAEVDPRVAAPVDRRRLDTVKFGSCVPDDALAAMLAGRDADPAGTAQLIDEAILLA
jgi:ATP-dependent Lhr-like helicase